MKKIILIVILLFLTLAIVSCKDSSNNTQEEVQKTKVTLTTQNYTEYLAISYTVSKVEHTTYYTFTVASTSPNYSFEYVRVKIYKDFYNIPSSGNTSFTIKVDDISWYDSTNNTTRYTHINPDLSVKKFEGYVIK